MNKRIPDFGRFITGVLLCLFAMTHTMAQDRHIAAGYGNSLYVDPAGNVWTWGDAKLSAVTDQGIPTLVMQNGRSVSASPEEYKSYIIKQDGSLWGWGASYYGQMGIVPEAGNRFVGTPRKVMDQVSVVSGRMTIFALKPDGSLWVWGSAEIQRGDTDDRNWTEPHKVMEDVAEVSSTFAHTVIRKKDGSLWAWGGNQCGALGTGDTESRVRPVRVNVAPLGERQVVQIATRWGETYLLADDGTVWYSGEYNINQEDCLDVPRLVPTKLDRIEGVGAIALGKYHELYLKKDGTVWASGYGAAASAPWMTVPAGVGKVMDDVVEIAGGGWHSMALKKDGSVWVWGMNDLGQLGNGTNVGSLDPIQVHFARP